MGTVARYSGERMDKGQTESIIMLYDTFASSPASIMSKEAVTALGSLSESVQRAADLGKTIDAQKVARDVKTKQRLTSLFTGIQQYQASAQAALEAGDIAAHARSLDSLKQAIRGYKDAYKSASVSEDAKGVSDEIAKRKANDRVTGAATQLNDMIVRETQYQLAMLEQQRIADAVVADGVRPLFTQPDGAALDSVIADMLNNGYANNKSSDPYDIIGGMYNGNSTLGTEGLSGDRGQGGAGTVREAARAADRGTGPARETTSGIRGYDQTDTRVAEQAKAAFEAKTGRKMEILPVSHVSEKSQMAAKSFKSVTGKDVAFYQSEGALGYNNGERIYAQDTDMVGHILGHEYIETNHNGMLDRAQQVHIPETIMERYLEARSARTKSRYGGSFAENLELQEQQREFVADMGGVFFNNVFTGEPRDYIGLILGEQERGQLERSAGGRDTLNQYSAQIGELARQYEAVFAAALEGEGAIEVEPDGSADQTLGSIINRDESEKAYSDADIMSQLVAPQKGDGEIPRYRANDNGLMEQIVGEHASVFGADIGFMTAVSGDDNYSSIKEQLINHAHELQDMEPVAIIKCEPTSGLSKQQRLQRIVDHYGTSELSVDRQGYGKIIVDRKRINSSLDYINTDVEFAAFSAVPYVIKRGKAIAGHDNHKGRNIETITFAAPITVNGMRGNMAVVVRQEAKNYYKTHRVILPAQFDLIKTGNAEPTTGGGTIQSDNGSTPISSASINSMPHDTIKMQEDSAQNEQNSAAIDDNGSQDISFSTNAPDAADGGGQRQSFAQEVMATARGEYEKGTTAEQWYQSNKDSYDERAYRVGLQLQGMALRNGERVGGRLSLAEMEDIVQDSTKFKKKPLLAAQSPIRVFENMGAWRDNRTDEGMFLNMHASEKYSELYYSYKESQLAKRNLFATDLRQRVAEIGADKTDSVLAQLMGEKIITDDQARSARKDGKHIFVPLAVGAMVFDHKGRTRYIVDSNTLYIFDDNVIKKAADRRREIAAVAADNAAGKSNRIREIEQRYAANRPVELTDGYYTVSSGEKYGVYTQAGAPIFEMSGTPAYTETAARLADTLTDVYAEIHPMIQESLVSNGYRPAGKRENYFPHISRELDGINGAVEYLRSEDLPVEIAGLTETFSPGKPWARNLMERTGDFSEYDAVRGFNGYLESISDVIFMTPVIQRLRQLESALRTGKASSNSLSVTVNPENANMAAWLHEYTNGIANKKAVFDRGAENIFGRKAYTATSKLSGIIGTASIAGNVSTAMSQLIPFAQNAGQMDTRYVLRGMKDTVASMVNGGADDGLDSRIDFLVNRLTETDQIMTSMGDITKQKGMKALCIGS